MVPKILPFNFGEEDYTSGMSAQLQCIVTEGDIPVDIRWITSGQTHSTLEGITFTKIGSKSSIMQIDSVDASHSGNYTCLAKNSAGQTSYTAQLTVVGISLSDKKKIPMILFSSRHNHSLRARLIKMALFSKNKTKTNYFNPPGFLFQLHHKSLRSLSATMKLSTLVIL